MDVVGEFFLAVVALRVRTVQARGNDLKLIPTVKMENGHPVESPFGRETSSIYIVRELWLPEFASRSTFSPKISPKICV